VKAAHRQAGSAIRLGNEAARAKASSPQAIQPALCYRNQTVARQIERCVDVSHSSRGRETERGHFVVDRFGALTYI
jgi:transposase-like protein